MIRLRGIVTVFGLATVSMLFATPGLAQQQPPDPEGAPDPPFSPRGAFLRSVVLPGWGQAYVGAPGRGAVYFGLAGGSIWMSYVAKRQLESARDEQAWLRDSGQIEPDAETPFAFARAQHFEDWAALSVFLMFLAGADAYVAAYLSDFDERIGVMPEAGGGLRFEARFAAPGGQ
ncbi:MAG: DUF5683 domain-containing protein [Gemmatimonadota bacterium]